MYRQHAKDYIKVNDIMNQLCVPKFRCSNAFEMPKFRQRICEKTREENLSNAKENRMIKNRVCYMLQI